MLGGLICKYEAAAWKPLVKPTAAFWNLTRLGDQPHPRPRAEQDQDVRAEDQA